MAIVALAEKHLARVLEIEAASNGAPWSERAFRNEIDNPQGVFVVSEEKGHQVTGFGGMWMVVDEAHITTLAVDPAHRRRGIGAKIMRVLLDEARARGMTCSTLEVRAGNEAAIMLYESLGYVRVAVRRRYYPDNREDAVIMWLYEL